MAYDRMIRALFALLALGLPLVWAEGLLQFSYTPKRILVDLSAWLLLTVYLLKLSREEHPGIRRSFFHVPLGLFLLFALLSLFSATNLALGGDRFLHFLSLSAIFIVAFHHFRAVGQIDEVFDLLILSGEAAVGIGICQYFGTGFAWITQTESPGITFAHQNMAAEYLILIMPLALYRGMKSTRTWKTFLYFLVAALFVTFSFYVRARAAWIGIVFSSLVGLGLWLIRRRAVRDSSPPRGKKFIPALAAAMLMFVMTWAMPPPPDQGDVNFTERVASIARTGEGTTPFRMECWRSSWGMIRENPILGVGLGNWELFFPRYLWTWSNEETEEAFGRRGDADLGVRTGSLYAHNDYLQLVAELGVGAVLFVLLLVFAVFRAATRICRTDQGGEISACVIAATMSAVLFGTIAAFSFPFELSAPGAVFYIMLGILASLESPARSERRIPNGAMLAALGATLLILISSAVYHYRLVRADRCVYLTDFAKTPEEKISLFKESAAWYWYNYNTHFYLGYLHQEIASLYFGDLEQSQGQDPGLEAFVLNEYAKSLESYRNTVEINPYYLQATYNMALIFHRIAEWRGESRYYIKALELYHRLLTILPDHLKALRRVAEISCRLGQWETAERFLGRYIKMGKHLRPKDLAEAADLMNIIRKNLRGTDQ